MPCLQVPLLHTPNAQRACMASLAREWRGQTVSFSQPRSIWAGRYRRGEGHHPWLAAAAGIGPTAQLWRGLCSHVVKDDVRKIP